MAWAIFASFSVFRLTRLMSLECVQVIVPTAWSINSRAAFRGAKESLCILFSFTRHFVWLDVNHPARKLTTDASGSGQCFLCLLSMPNSYAQGYESRTPGLGWGSRFSTPH